MLRFVPLFLSSTLISLNYGALIYLNSSFLEDHFSKGLISLFYLAGALGNIILFLLAPRLLNRFSKEGLYFIFLVITALSTFAMTVSSSPLSAALSFIAYASFLFMVYYFLDIFLEEVTTDGKTGSIRGIYYAFVNGGIALGPLMVSLLSKGELLKPVYYVATATLLIPSVIAAFMLWRGPERLWHPKRNLQLPFRSLWHRRNLRAVTLARFVLEAFFAIMVIYTPLYLHNNMGFEWSELGIIFTVMLLPFVILEWPAGEAADRWWGEKEMMSFGFFLTGTMLLVMPFLGQSFSAWLIVLLISRVGACLIEITTESYFFKKISAAETGFLAIFRITRPMALIFGAAVGALTVGVFSFEKIFFVTAIIVLFGMKESLHLKDTL
jgi:predicted MFS family arabinose efflux permease